MVGPPSTLPTQFLKPPPLQSRHNDVLYSTVTAQELLGIARLCHRQPQAWTTKGGIPSSRTLRPAPIPSSLKLLPRPHSHQTRYRPLPMLPSRLPLSRPLEPLLISQMPSRPISKKITRIHHTHRTLIVSTCLGKRMEMSPLIRPLSPKECNNSTPNTLPST